MLDMKLKDLPIQPDCIMMLTDDGPVELPIENRAQYADYQIGEIHNRDKRMTVYLLEEED